MKTAEKILLLILVIALLMKFFDIPGGRLLTLVTIQGLSLFYLIGGYFLFRIKSETGEEIFIPAVSLISGGILMYLLIGGLFGVMKWPGANVMLLVTLPLPVLFCVFLGVMFQKNDEKSSYYFSLLTRFGIGIVTVCLFFVE